MIVCNEKRLDRCFITLIVIMLVIISAGFGIFAFHHTHFEQCEDEYDAMQFNFGQVATNEDLSPLE